MYYVATKSDPVLLITACGAEGDQYLESQELWRYALYLAVNTTDLLVEIAPFTCPYCRTDPRCSDADWFNSLPTNEAKASFALTMLLAFRSGKHLVEIDTKASWYVRYQHVNANFVGRLGPFTWEKANERAAEWNNSTENCVYYIHDVSQHPARELVDMGDFAVHTSNYGFPYLTLKRKPTSAMDAMKLSVQKWELLVQLLKYREFADGGVDSCGLCQWFHGCDYCPLSLAGYGCEDNGSPYSNWLENDRDLAAANAVLEAMKDTYSWFLMALTLWSDAE